MAATMVETEDFPGMHELEPVRTPSPLWLRPVEWLAGALFVALVVVILTNIFTREVLSQPIPWIDEVTSLVFVWLAMLGAVLAVERSEHMRLTVFLPLFPPRLLPYIHGFAGADDYWRRASAKPWLKSIAIPTLAVNPKNDPFLPAIHLPSRAEISPTVSLEQPVGGGHVGFVSGNFPGNLDWLPQRLLHFFLFETS